VVFEQLKRLAHDSLIYGLGHIATRLITFLLLPYYSFHLSPAEYGELTLYFLFIAIMQALYTYGMDVAYLRYFTLSKDQNRRKVVTGTTLLASLLSSAAFTIVILIAASAIGHLVIYNPADPSIVPAMIRVSAGILFFDTLATFPFIFLRGTLRPYHFIMAKIFNVAANISLNIWFVGGLSMGTSGILWANFIASAATLFVLLPMFWKSIAFRLDSTLLREMVVFGIPNIPTYLFVMIIELADRKIIEIFRGAQEAGLYSAGYKLGMFMAVVTGAFRFAWQPFFLSHSDREDAPRLFARVLTYYLLITIVLFLALTFFLNPIVKKSWPGIGFILDSRYWPGLSVFPIILLAHIFDGIYANLMPGVYLKKLTSKLPLVTGVAAAFTIAACLLLIPRWGMMAAAWITLAAFVIEVVILWGIVQKAYPVPYEWRRILLLAIAAAAVLFAGYLPLLDRALPRFLLLILFPVLLYSFGFADERERHHLKKLISRS
jgi:O-antigen/teichoic acid export membrane protein